MSAFNFIDEYKTDDPKLGHVITKGISRPFVFKTPLRKLSFKKKKLIQ